MYKLTILTPYNTIYLLVDDINDRDIKEIVRQPWVKRYEYYYISDDTKVDACYKRLIRRKDTQ